MTRIIAIRPEPGLSATLEAGRELGLDISGMPLFEIRPIDWQPPEAGAIDALLIGSANAIRHGGENLKQFLDKPIHAVGKTTKKVALDAGFTIASVGEGGLQNVLDRIAPPARLLRIAGVEHVPLDVPQDIEIETVVAYESVSLPFDPAIIDAEIRRTIVLLHSAVAAEHFARECDRLGIARDRLEIAALGPRIASAAGKGWGAIHVAPRPNDADLLALARGLCQ